MFKIDFEKVVKENKRITRLQRIVWKIKLRIAIKINSRRYKKELKKRFDDAWEEIREDFLKDFDEFNNNK